MNHKNENQCSRCIDPNWTLESDWAQMESNINEFGLHLVGVSGEGQTWTYTVGLAENELPELVITDVPFECAGALLNSIAAQMMLDGRPVDEVATSIRTKVGLVHPNHIEGGLIAMWESYYRDRLPERDQPRLELSQIVLGPEQFCVGHVNSQTRLNDPHVRLLHREGEPRGRHVRDLGDGASFRPRRQPNRAERRASRFRPQN